MAAGSFELIVHGQVYSRRLRDWEPREYFPLPNLKGEDSHQESIVRSGRINSGMAFPRRPVLSYFLSPDSAFADTPKIYSRVADTRIAVSCSLLVDRMRSM